MQKSLQKPSIPKQQEISDLANSRKTQVFELAKAIISGETNVGMMEMSVNITENIKSPNIQSVFKDENIQVGFTVVKILVDRFVDSFGFSSKLSATQTETICIDTFDNFRGESLGDIVLFFKMARNGSFGSTHRGIDSNLIFGDWFPKYLIFKAEEREKVYQKEKSNLLKQEISLEEVRKHYESYEKSLLQQAVDHVETITEGITRDELELLIAEWRKDAFKSKFIRVLLNKRLTIK